MNFSLIKPELRPIFSLFSRIWIVFILVVFGLLFVLNLFVLYKNYSIKNGTAELKSKQIQITKEIDQIAQIREVLDAKIEIANSINASNAILKQSIHNLFDLVPDSITLDEVMMDKHELIIRGITPTKDVFNQLLGSPLKSIFNSSNSSFFQIQNGWFGFVNTNKMDNSEGYNE